jgi:hypothetical protein
LPTTAPASTSTWETYANVIDAHLGREPVYVVVREDDEMAGLIGRYAMTPVAGTGNSLLLVTGRSGTAP